MYDWWEEFFSCNFSKRKGNLRIRETVQMDKKYKNKIHLRILADWDPVGFISVHDTKFG